MEGVGQGVGSGRQTAGFRPQPPGQIARNVWDFRQLAGLGALASGA